MAALNPFFNEADEDDSGSAEEESGGLPEPVKVTTGDKQSVINDNDKSEREEDETLELNVNQLEFEELGGTVAFHKKATKKSIDNSKDKDEDDVEIIETSNRMNKKTTVEPIIHPESRTSSDPLYTAKLIQLNKSGSYVTKGKVKSGTVEVLDGEYKGKKAFFQVGCCYVWGYHMANANLMYNLRSGDKFQVSITVKEGVAVDDVEVPLLVKKAWLGIQSEKPVLSADDLEFATWLIERNLSEEEFLQWISDKLPPKPFFPLKTEVYEAKVIMLIRENPKGDGALVRIVKEGDMRDNLAVFERDDFYLCGVHVGEADMRFLIRPGDTCSIQIRELSEREKKARCKKYPKLEEFEFNYTCLLAYTGDIRPRGPNMRPAESQELKMFLEQKGMSIQEFEEMRNISDENVDLEAPSQSDDIEPPGTGVTPLPAPVTATAAAYPAVTLPPATLTAVPQTSINSNMSWLLQSQASGGIVNQFPQPNPATLAYSGVPAVFPQPAPALTQTQAPSSDQVEKIAKCNTLVARAVLIGSGKRKNISELLKTDEDFELGYFLADIFTSALVSGVQNKIKSKVFDKMGTGASAALDSQSRQLDMVRAQLLSAVPKPKPSDIIQAATNVALAANKPASQAMMEAQQKTLASLPPATISQVELYDKQQQEARADFGSNKGLQSMSDMKKRLEAFKAAKNVNKSLQDKISKSKGSSPDVIEVNDSRSSRWDNTDAMEEQSMKPVDLIRKYVRMKRNIELRDGKVYFRELSFSSGVKTNLTISRSPGELTDYYTVGCLAYFIRNISDDHPEYVRKCICDKIQCVRRVDRDNIKAYLTGEKDFVLNLDNGVSSEYGGSTQRSSHSKDITNVDLRKRTRSRSKSRDRGKRRRSRSRSRSRERRRRSRSRDRGRRSRSRSRDRNRDRGRTSRERGDREMGYNPDDPTSSPNQTFQNHQRSTFDHRDLAQVAQFGQNKQSGFNSFDQRPSFDQTSGNGFDQRPSDTSFTQRPIGYPVGFGGMDMGGGGFDQRISERLDQGPLNPQAFSGFDQRSQNMTSGSGFDQRGIGASRFNQFQRNVESGFNERSSQEMDSRGSWGNERSQMERSQMNQESDFSEYDAPSESQQQWRNSMDKSSNQRLNFGRDRINIGQEEDQSGRHRNFMSSDFDEYGGGDMRQKFMNSDSFSKQRSINNDDDVRDADAGDGDDNEGSNLGPMFVIGQNSSKSSAPRRW